MQYKELEVCVKSGWLKENMESLYDGIITLTDQFAEDEFDSFTEEDAREMKEEGFEAEIIVKKEGENWKIITYVNESSEPWMTDNIEQYPKLEIEALYNL